MIYSSEYLTSKNDLGYKISAIIPIGIILSSLFTRQNCICSRFSKML